MPAGAGQRRKMPAERDHDPLLLPAARESDHMGGVPAAHGQRFVGAALEKARVVGDSGLLYMPTDPMLQSLRGDPRYAQLLKAMGLA